MSDSIFAEKRKYSKLIKDFYWFKNKNKPNWLVIIDDFEKVKALTVWLSILPCDFVIKWEFDENKYENIYFSNSIKKDILKWYDFILTDNNIDWLKDYLNNYITPILPINNYLSQLFTEFNPINNVWNSYLYQDGNIWSMFYALVRYLENYKFPYDNRNLVKNLLTI